VYDRTRRPGSILGNLNQHNSKNFKFSPRQPDLLGNDYVHVMAWHVDVSGAGSIALGAIPSLSVSRTGGPDIMVTTLLNGCSFICEPRANDVLMAHVQPTGGITGAQLETNIINTGALVGGGGGSSVFGAARCYSSAANDVTIIGVRTNTHWRVFAQIHPGGQRTVLNVVEFFNG
jgi:hypothetical protein